MKYGNRGANQPCIDLRTGRCYITPQVQNLIRPAPQLHPFSICEHTFDPCCLNFNQTSQPTSQSCGPSTFPTPQIGGFISRTNEAPKMPILKHETTTRNSMLGCLCAQAPPSSRPRGFCYLREVHGSDVHEPFSNPEPWICRGQQIPPSRLEAVLHQRQRLLQRGRNPCFETVLQRAVSSRSRRCAPPPPPPPDASARVTWLQRSRMSTLKNARAFWIHIPTRSTLQT